MKNKTPILIIVFCLLNVAIIGRAYPYALRTPIDKTYQRPLEFLDSGIIESKGLDFQKVKSAIENAGGNLSKAARICGVKRPLFAKLLDNYGLSWYPEQIKIERIYSALKKAGGNLTRASEIYYGEKNQAPFQSLAEDRGLLPYAKSLRKSLRSKQLSAPIQMTIPDETILQSILRDTLEAGIIGPETLAKHEERRAILKQFYVEGHDIKTIASNLDKQPNTVKTRIKRDKDALCAWLLEQYGISIELTERALTALRKPVKWISGHRDWLNRYEEWLKNPADNQPDSINFDKSKYSEGFYNFCRKHLKMPVPMVKRGQIIPRFDPNYGFLLEIKNESGVLLHRYLMADIQGKKMESSKQGSSAVLGWYGRHPKPGVALQELLWHTGPVDLLLAFKPRHTIVEHIVLLDKTIHFPPTYSFPVIVPDVSGADLAEGRKIITLYGPSESGETGPEGKGQAVERIIITESEDGGLEIQTQWLGSYGKRATGKRGRDIQKFLRGKINIPPESSIAPVIKMHDKRNGHVHSVVCCARLIFIPAAYSDNNSFLLAAFYSSTGERLLGIWQLDSDPENDMPIKVLRLRNGKYENVSLSDGQWRPALNLPRVDRGNM